MTEVLHALDGDEPTAEVPRCANGCCTTLETGKLVSRKIRGKTFNFCSEKCAKEFVEWDD